MANHHMACVAQEYVTAAYEQQRPSAIYRPRLSIDGNQWCALYGDNLQDGVAGFGDSPALAMEAFDKAWKEKLQQCAASESAATGILDALGFPSVRATA
jgi:hypothetical protein